MKVLNLFKQEIKHAFDEDLERIAPYFTCDDSRLSQEPVFIKRIQRLAQAVVI